MVGRFHGAQFAVKVDITALITNCPRYVPKMERISGSGYVPDAVWAPSIYQAGSASTRFSPYYLRGTRIRLTSLAVNHHGPMRRHGG